MKRIIIVSCVFFTFACESENLPPELRLDPECADIGTVAVNPTDPYRINLQLTNVGDEALEIKNVALKADQHCVFSFRGPSEKKIGRNDSAFVTMWFEPKTTGEYRVKLVINSNSSTGPKTSFNIYSNVVSQAEMEALAQQEAGADTAQGTGGVDAGVPAPGGAQGKKCDMHAPPPEQPDCPTPNWWITDTDTSVSPTDTM